MFIYQIGIMFIVMKRGISKDLFTYDMASMCGRTVVLDDIRDGRVYFHQNGRHIQTCKLALSNPDYGLYAEIAFHFTDFSGTGHDCIHIGQLYASNPNLYSKVDGLEPSYCNGTFPDLNTNYETSHYMTLFITFDTHYKGNTSFEFVFNAFATMYHGNCKNSYRCDNDRCIPNEVNCNGHNPCGDNSDCQIRDEKNDNDDSQDKSIFEESQNIVIVVAIVVAVIGVITCVLCGRKQVQRETVTELTSRPVATSGVSHEVLDLARPLIRQVSSQDTHRSLIDDTTHTSELLDYSTQAIADLPPSYKDVICNEQKYTNIERMDP